jgi:ATP-dependent Clp protease ATP-binding subunit ClpB
LPDIERQLLESELKPYFHPEFLNRFDNIIVFKPLTHQHVLDITRLLLKRVGERLAEQGITLAASEAAIGELAEIGFDPLFGARPLRRVIQERVDSPIARYLLEGRLRRRDNIIVEPGGSFTIKKAKQL